MAGEMYADEVTRESFPELFALRDALRRSGIESAPRPFDQYQGPYLEVPEIGRVWYGEDAGYGAAQFLIEADGSEKFATVGACYVVEADERNHKHGRYTVRQAARYIRNRVKLHRYGQLP